MSEKQNIEKQFLVSVQSCDEIKVMRHDANKFTFSVIGCSETLALIKNYMNTGQSILEWSLPEGHGHSELLLKELILKARGEWTLPYDQIEICHCRAVTTEKVDQSIICGAHDMKSIQRATSASTACGTCRDDVMKLLKYRLGQT